MAAPGIALCLLSCQVAAPRGEPDEEPELDTLVGEVLRWLPDDTETLIVAQGPFALEKEDPDQPLPFERHLQYIAVSLLDTIAEGVYMDRALGRKIRLAVEGARRFREPTGLGMTRYSGAQILVFAEEEGRIAGNLFAAMRRDGAIREIEGHEVVALAEKREQDEWTFLAACPRPDVLILSTDEEYLAEVLRRGAGPLPRGAFPNAWPEWRHVDTTARFWAVRHYDAANAVFDATSPLRVGVTASEPDPHAVGLAVCARDGERSVRIRYLTGSGNGLSIARGWGYEDLKPRIRWWADHVVQVDLAPPRGESPQMVVFLLLDVFGHAIYQ